MLNSTIIDRDYFNQVSEELLNETMTDTKISGDIRVLMSFIMMEFSQNMSDRLFGKMEDK